MEKNLVKRAPKGDFVEDPAGLCHYFVKRTGTGIEDAIEDALSNRPRFRPAWFWFNGLFTPIQLDDTVETLHARWESWADAYRSSPIKLKKLIEDYSRTSG